MLYLSEFKTGKYNVLFATDVVEEGLDVKACQFVINYDLPATVKSFIQRKGRARAACPQIVALVPYDKIGTKMIKDLLLFTKQESVLESSGENNIETEPVEIPLDDALDFITKDRSKNDCNGSNDLVNNISSITNSTPIIDEVESPPISSSIVMTRQNLSLTKQQSKETYVVATTGAICNVSTSIQRLMQFCQNLPHDSFFCPHPIYWMDTFVGEMNESGNPYSYRCSVLLPSCVHPSVRFIVGPITGKKTLAKSLVSLECIKKLHNIGELNDWLVTNGSKMSEKYVKMQLQKDFLQRKRKVDGTGTGTGSKKRRKLTEQMSKEVYDGLAEEYDEDMKGNKELLNSEMDVVTVVIKVVPDKLCIEAKTTTSSVSENISNSDDMKTETEVTLYLYAIRVSFLDEKTKDITTDCKGCGVTYSSLQQLGNQYFF